MSNPTQTRNPTWIFLTLMKERLIQGWIQGPYARDHTDRVCSPLAEAACAWCLHGAACRVTWELGLPFLFEGEVYLLSQAARSDAAHMATTALTAQTENAPRGCGSLILFNEYPGQTKEAVLALVDRALAEIPATVESEAPREIVAGRYVPTG